LINRARKGGFLYSAPAIAYAFLIFFLSSIPNFPERPEVLLFPFADKLAHIVEYAIFGFLLHIALVRSNKERLVENSLFLSIIIGILYGISDEVHQYFVQGREADPLDAVMDAVGIITVALFLCLARKKPQIELDNNAKIEDRTRKFQEKEVVSPTSRR